MTLEEIVKDINLEDAIKKQTPRKYKLEWNADKIYSWEKCSVCERSIEKEYKYCPNCGQAIKWD